MSDEQKLVEQMDEQSAKINLARDAILDELRRRWLAERGGCCGVTAPRDISRFFKPQKNYFCGMGKMACPVCKTGTLHYDRSGYNGHVSAQCTTEGCVWWRE